MRNKMKPTLCALATMLFSNVSVGGEVCVSCADPAQTYRCVIAEDDVAARVDQATQLLCIKEIAASGHHASCSVDRARSNPCEGVPITVARSEKAKTGGLASSDAAAPVAVDPSAPPQTVEALAKQSAAQSKKDWDETAEKVKETAKVAGQGIETAGSVVGGAAKKTWDCMTSLFSKC
jgi:hypothetical protein